MGGLSAGVHSALAGKKVLVLEQHNLPGGFATSFVRGRYEFEATLHELLDFDTPENMGPIRELLEEASVEYELNRVPEPYVIVLPEDDIFVKLPFGIENFIEKIEEEVPGSKKEVSRYMKLCNNVYEGILYLRECTEKGKKIMMPYWCYMICWYLTTGAYVPTERSHALSTSLTERIRELGGQVEFNCRVEKIHIKDQRVEAVELGDGTVIETNIVLSNAHPDVVYGKMIELRSEVPEYHAKKTNAQINSCSAVTVYLGLNATPDEIGIKDYEYFIGDTGNVEEIYKSFYEFKPSKRVSAICLDKAVPGTTGEGIC